MKLLIAGVLHPKNVKFLNDFLSGLLHQTNGCFDLLIVCENTHSHIDTIKTILNNVRLRVVSGQVNAPIVNRNILVNECLRLKYDAYIFCDLDDIISYDMVSSVRLVLDSGNFNVSFCDVVPFKNQIDVKASYWSNRDIFERQIPNFKSNIYGLGNTAILHDLLESFEPIQNKLIYDWEFWLRLAYKEVLRPTFCGGKVFYRVHDESILGGQNHSTRSRIALQDYKLQVLRSLDFDEVNVKYEIDRTRETIRQLIKNPKSKIMKYPFWFEESI